MQVLLKGHKKYIKGGVYFFGNEWCKKHDWLWPVSRTFNGMEGTHLCDKLYRWTFTQISQKFHYIFTVFTGSREYVLQLNGQFSSHGSITELVCLSKIRRNSLEFEYQSF
jgi:hypothetical protein